MPMDATIDGGHPLAHQPADYKVIPLDAVVDIAADGTPIVSKRNGHAGKQVEWTWGDVVDPATVTELVTARGGTIAHEIEFNDKNAVGHAYNVVWLSDPAIEGGPGLPYRPLTVRFLVVESSD